MSEDSGMARTRFSEEELRALAARGIVRKFPKNAVVVSEGDDTDPLYIILSGRVKVIVSDEEGGEVVLGMRGPSEYFGEFALDGGPRSASIVALEPSSFAVIPRDQVREFLRSHPDFSVHLIEQLIERTRELTESVKRLVLMDVYGRVTRLLLELAQKENGKLVIREKLTQQDIASRVGSSREMISRIFKELVAGSYITVEQKHITINKALPRRR